MAIISYNTAIPTGFSGFNSPSLKKPSRRQTEWLFTEGSIFYTN
jgi:hypothetical protein